MTQRTVCFVRPWKIYYHICRIGKPVSNKKNDMPRRPHKFPDKSGPNWPRQGVRVALGVMAPQGGSFGP
jgi:hypothetical protein